MPILVPISMTAFEHSLMAHLDHDDCSFRGPRLLKLQGFVDNKT